MSVMIHIRKTEEWDEAKKNPITLEEIKEFVKNEPDFELREGKVEKIITPKGDTIT